MSHKTSSNRVGRPVKSLGLHACLHLWTVTTSLVRFAKFQEPRRRSLLLSMQQSAISTNGLASQPSHSRLHEPSTREMERHQIQGNTNLINPILVANVLEESELESLTTPASPSFPTPDSAAT